MKFRTPVEVRLDNQQDIEDVASHWSQGVCDSKSGELLGSRQDSLTMNRVHMDEFSYFFCSHRCELRQSHVVSPLFDHVECVGL